MPGIFYKKISCMVVKQFLTAIFILVMYKMARGFLRISLRNKKGLFILLLQR